MKIKKFKYKFFCSLLIIFSLLIGCNDNTGQELAHQVSQSLEYLAEIEEAATEEPETPKQDSLNNLPDPNSSYTSVEEVALYLHEYGELPSNFITKNEAKSLGWISKEENLAQVAPGKSIGGDRFWNNEEILPEKEGREYYECDINSDGGYRDAERIVYSNDGLIYYTSDHYETFQLLYGSGEEKEP